MILHSQVSTELYFVFFSESPKRWAILQKFAEDENITLKNVSNTRWSSRDYATKCVLLNLPKIYAALREIANAPKPDASCYRYEASNLAKKICKFQFICGVVVWHYILSKINIVSKSLQAQSIDITRCLKLIEKLREHFKEIRESGVIIDEWFDRAKQIQSEFCFEAIALDNMATQQRPARSEIEDWNEDDKDKFKISFVYPILDVALSKLEERFEHLTELENLFGFLFDLHSPEISLDQCQRLENALTSTQDGSKDLYATQLLDEIKSLQALIDDDGEKSTLEFLNKIHGFGLVPIYPNRFAGIFDFAGDYRFSRK